jgi:hypothetical protein
MTRLALDEPHIIRSDTIGHAWLAVAGRVAANGVPSRYDDLPAREISLVTLAVARPDPDDEVIARHAEPERLAWMHANFTDRPRVAALGDADSYATRLFDYEHSGRDQIWEVSLSALSEGPNSRRPEAVSRGSAAAVRNESSERVRGSAADSAITRVWCGNGRGRSAAGWRSALASRGPLRLGGHHAGVQRPQLVAGEADSRGTDWPLSIAKQTH